MNFRRLLFGIALCLWFAACCAEGRSQAADVPVTANALLQRMSVAAGVVFAGQVTAVRRPPGYAGSAEDAGEGVVEIEFRVDDAVRGCSPGQAYVLREWAGLWAGNAERYRVGQRRLMFLRSADGRGLSSPVHGAEGAVPIRGGGIAPGPDDTATEGAQWLVDLRWVQARVVRRRMEEILPVTGPGREPGRDSVELGMSSGAALSQLRLPKLTGTTFGAVSPGSSPLAEVLELCRESVRSRGADR